MLLPKILSTPKRLSPSLSGLRHLILSYAKLLRLFRLTRLQVHTPPWPLSLGCCPTLRWIYTPRRPVSPGCHLFRPLRRLLRSIILRCSPRWPISLETATHLIALPPVSRR